MMMQTLKPKLPKDLLMNGLRRNQDTIEIFAGIKTMKRQTGTVN